MKRVHLTQQEKEALELRHSQSQERKEGDRIKAVLLRSEGWTVPMIYPCSLVMRAFIAAQKLALPRSTGIFSEE